MPQMIAVDTISVKAFIGASTTLSPAIDLKGHDLGAIIVPTNWTAANITFQGCDTLSGTFRDIYDDSGTLYTATAAANRCITNLNKLAPFQFIKLKSTATQNQDQDITLICTGLNT